MASIFQNPILRNITNAAVHGILVAAQKPTNPLSLEAVSASSSTSDIQREVEKAVVNSPELQHITNTEVWYQKRSRWSAIIGTAAPVIGMGLKMLGIEATFGAEEQIALTDALMGVGAIWAAYLAYRAGTATKPLGA